MRLSAPGPPAHAPTDPLTGLTAPARLAALEATALLERASGTARSAEAPREPVPERDACIARRALGAPVPR